MISANTGSNFGMCSSSGGLNVCADFFFGDDLVFDEDTLSRSGTGGGASFGGGSGGGSSMASCTLGSSGRGLDVAAGA